MIQRIREANTGMEYVCEVPPGWQAAVLRNNPGFGFSIVLVPENGGGLPILCTRNSDGVWRQRTVIV